MNAPDIEPAPLPHRVGALVYDLLIVLALLLVVGLAAQLATGGRLVAMEGGHARVPGLYVALQWLVVGMYFLLSWLRGGQTLGARAWRLRVAGVDGAAPQAWRIVLRLALAAVPLLGLALGYVLVPSAALLLVGALWLVDALAMPFDRWRRCLHDRFSGTRMVRVARPPA